MSVKAQQELFKQLPDELKEALFSVPNAERVLDVAEKHSLSDAQGTLLQEEVTNVLVGVTTPDQFPGVLVRSLGIAKDVAETIAQEISRYIFFPVKATLEQLDIRLQRPIDPREAESRERTLPEAPEELRRDSSGQDPYRESLS